MGNMGEKSPSEVAAEQPAMYLLPLEPISEIDILVCGSGMTDHIKKITGIMTDHSPSLCPILRRSY